jgi:hypothetical protein
MPTQGVEQVCTPLGFKGLTFSPLYAIFLARANYTVHSVIANHDKLFAY